MSLRRVIIHESLQRVRIQIYDYHDFFIRARWGVRLGLIAEPPTEQRRADYFFENPEVFISGQVTRANPYFLNCDPFWWEVQRLAERNVFTIVEFKENENDSWREVVTFQWAINHDPIANAGPDQLITLDAGGVIPAAGVRLDGTGSTDVDLSSIDPDSGPLIFEWTSTGVPVGAENGATATAARSIAASANPTWLAAGTSVPQEERGVYTFDLKVSDREPAEIGRTMGQPGQNTANVRVLLGSTSDVLAILTPTARQPYYGNYDDGVSVVIHYAIGDLIANDPAYDGSWVVQLTIKQAINCPWLLPRPIGTPVYTEARVSRDRVGSFIWNGLANHNVLGDRMASPTEMSVGAYDITIELLNRRWQSTGVLAGTKTEARAVVLDLYRWRTPLEEANFEDTVLTGAFMETGHAGYPNTRLHAAIDMVGGRDFYAAQSGVYQRLSGSSSNTIQIGRRGSYRVSYLHGADPEGHTNNSIVLQGARLARISSVGTESVHLHFQLEEIDNQDRVLRLVNPLSVLSLPDTLADFPEINAVMVRRAPVAGAANLTRTGNIEGEADLIVLCRDKAHPNHRSRNRSFLTIYRLEVTENGIPWPPGREFDRFDPTTETAEDFYAAQGIGSYPRGDVSHLYYLLYQRWNTAPYGQDGGLRQYEIRAFDFAGRSSLHVLTIGCDVDRVNANALRISAAAPATIALELSITNRLSGLAQNNRGVVQDTDDFHVALVGQPAGWTITPDRTGSINSGASRQVTLQLNPHGSAPVGVHTFDIVVSSNIIRSIGTRLRVSVTVD